MGWRGSAYRDICAFPDEARRGAGHALSLLQNGRAPTDWKPMSVVGPGTIEIRIHTVTEHRVIVVSRFVEAVYVLHAFEKRTRKTPKHDLDLAKQRYKELIRQRAP